jgi:hypothetical protein
MPLAAVDWTNVLIAFIAGVPAIISAVGVLLVHGQVKTPSGKSIGEVAEYAHDTAIANNLLLSAKNGPTKEANKDDLRKEAAHGPKVPDESGAGGAAIH